MLLCEFFIIWKVGLPASFACVVWLTLEMERLRVATAYLEMGS